MDIRDFKSTLVELISNLDNTIIKNKIAEQDKSFNFDILIDAIQNYINNIDVLIESTNDELVHQIMTKAKSLLQLTYEEHVQLQSVKFTQHGNFLIKNAPYSKKEQSNYNSSDEKISNKRTFQQKYEDTLFYLAMLKNGSSVIAKDCLLDNREELKIIIDKLENDNKINKGTWTIGENYFFSGLTFEGKVFLENIQKSFNKIQSENSDEPILTELNIPSLEFKNLPEGKLTFSTWKEVYDWVETENQEWSHWYDYISEMPQKVQQGINLHRGPMVQLWSKSQKLLKKTDERDFNRYSKMAIKEIERVNDSNPIISYSKLGKIMIEAMDNNPDTAIEKYANNFVNLLDSNSVDNKTDTSFLELDSDFNKKHDEILKNYQNRNHGNAFNFIEKQKQKLNDIINNLEKQISLIDKNKDRENFNKLQNNLTKYLEIKKQYERIQFDSMFHVEGFKPEIKQMTEYLVEYLIENNYPKEIIEIEKQLYNTNKRVDISISYNNNIIAIIDITFLDGDDNSDEGFNNKLSSYYKIIKENQELKPRLFFVYPLDSMFILHEHDLDSKKNIRHDVLPDYSSLAQNNSYEIESKKIKILSNAYAHLSNDNPEDSEIDSLSIGNDINAFSKLIAYKGLIPPLSIGLFGRWGSGKSYFMQALERKINDLSLKSNDVFHKDIVHVKFNAWHYSDTNLLASLVYEIFNKIDEKINKPDFESSKTAIEKIKLYGKLKSAVELIEQKDEDKKKIESAILVYKEDIQTTKDEIENSDDYIKDLTIKDYSNLVWEDKTIKNDFIDIANKLALESNLDLNNIKNTYAELNTSFGIVKKAISLLIDSSLKTKLLIGSVFILVLVFSGIFYYYMQSIDMTILATLGTYITTISVLVRNKIQLIKPYINSLNNVLTSIESIKQEKRETDHIDIVNKKKQKQKLEDKKNHIELKLKELHESKLKIENEIIDIENGKYFREFISKRVSSTDYTKHLGLISLIRDDFTELQKFLLEDVHNNVDRIVLYIDDLDRCSDELVVDVLEAVHLLLAFKLFVVVVGVDTRWVHGALKSRHGNFTDEVTPAQYIEKIFQIPFQIKELDKKNKVDLIEDLLGCDVLKEEESQKKIATADVENIVIKDQDSVANVENKTPITGSYEDNIVENEQENNHEKLQITKDELLYIQKLADAIGNTPRTIKRFINIYRIIRVHEDINNCVDNLNEDYKIVILMLCELFIEDNNKSIVDYLDKDDEKYYNTSKLKDDESLKSLIGRFSFGKYN